MREAVLRLILCAEKAVLPEGGRGDGRVAMGVARPSAGGSGRCFLRAQRRRRSARNGRAG